MKVGIEFRYCNPTRFQTRDPKVPKWMFLLFVMKFLGKPFQKNAYRYYVTITYTVTDKRGNQNGKFFNFYLSYFSSNYKGLTN